MLHITAALMLILGGVSRTSSAICEKSIKLSGLNTVR
jgi:hypothetical protein